MKSYSQTQPQRYEDGASRAAWWENTSDGRIRCMLCPRECSLKPGDRGFCFVRENRDGELALTTYGKSTGFCIDPIEKKPLNHFYPGTPVLSFGTAGCNLGCKFCQNWDISKSREVQRLSSHAEPGDIAQAAKDHGCSSVAYTYNDPVIWAEYAIDTARQCRALGIKNVAVTAGYVHPQARAEFFAEMDAANVDLKAFTEEFYHKVTYSHLQPVLDTLVYLQRETDVWFELTNLVIPDANDNPGELRKMCDWVVEALGIDVPIHFSAFHPDFRMIDRPRTDPETLSKAYEIAKASGIRHAYVGNVHDVQRQSTYCAGCGALLIERDWYQLGHYHIDVDGRCDSCQTPVAGRFAEGPGNWGTKRQPIRIQSTQVHSIDAAGRPPDVQLNESSAAKEMKVTSVNNEASSASAPKAPALATRELLDLDSLQAEQKNALVQAAANWTVQAVYGEPGKSPQEVLGDLADRHVMGAFVTVKRGDLLRGCCGVLGKPMPLGAALASAAAKTAKEDQRMAPLARCELSHLSIDVTLLGPFEKIEQQGEDRIQAVEIGKQGLMIQHQGANGLLLPSVATERGWDARQFMQAVCNKASLPIGAWTHADAVVHTFGGVSMGGELKDLVPMNLANEAQFPLSIGQLGEYARVAGQNIVALITGGTPSYVLPNLPDVTVNAIVLSMQWGPKDGEAPELRQGNALQVSFRPGVALQSTLYQMCQQAATMFQRQQFTGQLQIGLSLGFEPAMHGYGMKADLDGADTERRGLIISDTRYCGFAYHPAKPIDELRSILHERMPIGSRDAVIHSVNVLSTMPHVISISGPSAVPTTGVRPPAVAGKFYPAEDAARRAMVGAFFKDEDPEPCNPLAIMVPHAGIKYCGRVAAATWRRVQGLEDRPIIIISPKHTAQGVNWAVCPFDSWQLSATTSIAGDPGLAKSICESVGPVSLDAIAHQQEHGIEVQLPFLERLAPSGQVVGMALSSGSWEDIQRAAEQFAGCLQRLPELPLLVISSDMNHYAPEDENRRRDRMALDALANGDPEKLIDVCRDNEISMCGLVPAALVMETLKQLGKSFRVEETDYATSGETTGDKSQVVGYAGAIFHEA